MVLNDEAMSEVGKIVTYFSYLEYTYKEHYGESKGLTREETFKEIGQMRFRDLISLFRKYVHENVKDDELRLKHFDDILNETLRLHDIRNEIVHGYWIGFSDESYKTYLNLRAVKDIGTLKDEAEKHFCGKMTSYTIEKLKEISSHILLNFFRLGIFLNHDAVFKYTLKYIK